MPRVVIVFVVPIAMWWRRRRRMLVPELGAQGPSGRFAETAGLCWEAGAKRGPSFARSSCRKHCSLTPGPCEAASTLARWHTRNELAHALSARGLHQTEESHDTSFDCPTLVALSIFSAHPGSEPRLQTPILGQNSFWSALFGGKEVYLEFCWSCLHRGHER